MSNNTTNLLPRTQRVIISYQNDDDLASKALAVALIRAFRIAPTLRDKQFECVASLSRHLLASSPQQLYVSTVKGIQTQPKRLHFSSLVDNAAHCNHSSNLTLTIFQTSICFIIILCIFAAEQHTQTIKLHMTEFGSRRSGSGITLASFEVE